MNLIGFTGQMGVGKSTAIQLLRSLMHNRNLDIHLVKFAQPLYDIQELVYKRIDSVYDRPENFVKDRKLLQWLGTDWGRDTISQSLWIDIWEAEVKRVWGCNPMMLVVCDDVRFDNEASIFKSLGGKIIKLESNRNVERVDTKAGIANHKSEAGVNPQYIDIIVENNGTLNEFEVSLYKAYTELGIL